MLIDTHAHINGREFEDVGAVVQRAAAAGVETIVCVGYDLPTTERALSLAGTDHRLFATVGMHPNSVGEAPAGWQARLKLMAGHPRVVAIGETGLDYYRDWTPSEQQRDALKWHLELADELGLPVIIHNRDADADVTDLLCTWAASRASVCPPGVLHSFAGTVEMMESCVAAGFAISFSGMVTFSNRSLDQLREVAAQVPDDAILVETDAPYLSPVPVRGQRNEPAHVRHTAARLAAIRGVTEGDFADLTTANARRIFPRLVEVSRA